MLKGKKLNPVSLVLVVGGLAVILMVFLIFTQFSTLGQVQENIAVESAALDQAQVQLQHLLLLRELGPVFLQNLELLEQLIPEKPGEDTLLVYLQNLSRETGAELVQVRFESSIQQQGYTEIPLCITFEGRFQDLLEITEQLENGNRLLRVNDIRISPGRNNLPEIKADFYASAFFLSQ